MLFIFHYEIEKYHLKVNYRIYWLIIFRAGYVMLATRINVYETNLPLFCIIQ